MEAPALVPERPNKRFDVAIVRWLSGSAEVDPCLVMVRPKIEQLPLEFAAGYRRKDIGGIPVARPTGLTLRP